LIHLLKLPQRVKLSRIVKHYLQLNFKILRPNILYKHR
jgi:hypothetical protein